MMTIQQAFELAIEHHQAGRLAEAEALYRQILAVQPEHADALRHLGVIAHQVSRHDLAVNLISRSIVLRPNSAVAHWNLGAIYCALGRREEGIVAYRQALRLKPDFADAHNDLGAALREQGDIAAAASALRRAIELKADFAEAHNNLGNTFQDLGQLEAAIAAYRCALEIKPAFPEAQNNLGNALKAAGRLEEAVAAYRHALELNPNLVALHFNVGIALQEQGRFDEAIAAYRRVLELQPGHVEAGNNLGVALKERGQLDEAIAVYQRALEFQPGFAEMHTNLGIAFTDRGQPAEALAAFRRVLQLDPRNIAAHGNLIYAMHFHPGCDAPAIAEEQRRWSRQFAEPLKQFVVPHANDRNPGRRVRVGYVSPHFFFQAEAFFVVPLFEAHDHQQYEIHCYASVGRPDMVTERLQRSADVWHDVRRLSDADLAERIRADEIDILVDLTMHMGRNRLAAFARKPAPVQVTWLAYPGSTGLATMDYRFTDQYLDPPAVETPYYSEKSVRLPDGWCCYHPLTEEPPVNPLPVTTTGNITFGCLNNFCKVNSRTVELYGKVLRAVEGSRLILLAPEGSARQRVLEQLLRSGIAWERMEFVGRMSRSEYLKFYHRIDIALDTLPYNGITTTCDALWMGVPVVTLVGETAPGRAGLGLLSMAQLPELATRTPDEFVRTAKRLAEDRSRLAELRRTLRTRMEGSVLMDAPRFARNIETAYRTMWRRWCTEETGQ